MHAVGDFLHYVAWQVCGGMLVVSPTRDMIASSEIRYVSHGTSSGGACSMGWPEGGGGAQEAARIQWGCKQNPRTQAAEGNEAGQDSVRNRA